MSQVLDSQKLKDILAAIQRSPNDGQVVESFLAIAQPIIRLTLDKFPSHLSDDIAQEIRVLLMRKAVFIADAYFKDQIQNVVNYLFTVSLNAATAYVKKEMKHDSHLVPIDDIKVEPVIHTKNPKKQKLLAQIKEDALTWVRIRFPEREDSRRAEKFVHVIMEGRRPSFADHKLRKWANQRPMPAKDIFSIVTGKIRELVMERQEELLE